MKFIILYTMEDSHNNKAIVKIICNKNEEWNYLINAGNNDWQAISEDEAENLIDDYRCRPGNKIIREFKEV